MKILLDSFFFIIMLNVVGVNRVKRITVNWRSSSMGDEFPKRYVSCDLEKSAYKRFHGNVHAREAFKLVRSEQPHVATISKLDEFILTSVSRSIRTMNYEWK